MKETAYLLQAKLVFLWWLGLIIDQNFYEAFQFPRIGKYAFNSFMLPDLLIIGLLSIIRETNNLVDINWPNMDQNLPHNKSQIWKIICPTILQG